MSEILNGSEIASRVLGSTSGAYAKKLFKIDTVNFSWIDGYLRDAALRNKIQVLRENIQKVQASPIHKDELKAMFKSALSAIKSDRLRWFTEALKSAQNRQGPMVGSNMLRHNDYTPHFALSKRDIEDIFASFPIGVKQVDIDAEAQRLREEILRTEELIARELCPHERWIYRDDGKLHPYPQGCRWTQYVTAWKKVVTRYDGPVSVEGLCIESDSEMTAYLALGLDNVSRFEPLRKPYSIRD